jgi:aryl-alcohol dehydrogenase-like predicted oxidoreductase
MQYRSLGRTGLRVGTLGLGTMVHAGHFGPMKDEESVSAIEAALELGVNFIDTSDAYGAGYSEALLGKILKGRRASVVLATKGGNIMVGPARGKRNFSAAYIDDVLHGSLKRLQSDWIDLYQLHNPDVETIERGEIWELLEKRKREGKIRHYGVSINTIAEGVAAVRSGRVETIQVEYNLLQQEPAKEIFPLAQAAGIGIIARVPLRRGLLSGKLTLSDEKRFQGEDLRARTFKGEAFAKELAKVEKLRFLVHGRVQTLGQAAIAFCIAHPAVSLAIAGARNDRQMRENAASADLTLPREDLDRVAELWRSGALS